MTDGARSATELERDFQRAMLGVYGQARDLGYPATRFKQMIDKYGGVQAAKRLLAKTDLQSGLMWLWEHGALAISMEALVLEEHFQPLFTELELAEAHRRLEDLGYFKASRE